MKLWNSPSQVPPRHPPVQQHSPYSPGKPIIEQAYFAFPTAHLSPAVHSSLSPHVRAPVHQPSPPQDMGSDTNFINAEDVFDDAGLVKPGCEDIVKNAVFMLPDGTRCTLEEIVQNNQLNIGSRYLGSPHSSQDGGGETDSSVTLPYRTPLPPPQPFNFKGVEVLPGSVYTVDVSGMDQPVQMQGSQLFRIQDDPDHILGLYNSAYYHITSIALPPSSRRPLHTQTSTTMTSTTEISNPAVAGMVEPVDRGTSPFQINPVVPSSPVKETVSPSQSPPERSPPPPPKPMVSEEHKKPLVYQITFNTIQEGPLKGVPLCGKGYPLRAGPYGHFLYPLSDKGEVLGPDGKPLPIAPDGRVKWPTDQTGAAICPKRYRVPVGPDGYPVLPDGRPFEPCGRLAVHSSQGPRLAVGPNNVVLYPVNNEGISCDLGGRPFALLSDGRPCWPCDHNGSPVDAAGRAVRLGKDGYPVDLKGRYLSPGGCIVIKTKMPYPAAKEIPLPEFLRGVTGITDKIITIPFTSIFDAEQKVKEDYRTMFNVPGVTIALPFKFMEHAPDHVYTAIQTSPAAKGCHGHTHSPCGSPGSSPFKPYSPATAAAHHHSSPYDAQTFYKTSPGLPPRPTAWGSPTLCAKHSPVMGGSPSKPCPHPIHRTPGRYDSSPAKQAYYNSPSAKPKGYNNGYKNDYTSTKSNGYNNGSTSTKSNGHTNDSISTKSNGYDNDSTTTSNGHKTDSTATIKRNSYYNGSPEKTTHYNNNNNNNNNYNNNNTSSPGRQTGHVCSPEKLRSPGTCIHGYPSPIRSPVASPSSPHYNNQTNDNHYTSPGRDDLYKGYEVPHSPNSTTDQCLTMPTSSANLPTSTGGGGGERKGKITPFYAVYLHNEWVQVAKKHARPSKSREDHMVVKYAGRTFLVPRDQIRPLQVSGAAPRELLTMKGQVKGAPTVTRTFSVERITQPEATDTTFVLQIVPENPPSEAQITVVKKEILSIHSAASILNEAQFRTLAATFAATRERPIMVRLEAGREPHYYRYVEELTPNWGGTAEKGTERGRGAAGGVKNFNELSIPC